MDRMLQATGSIQFLSGPLKGFFYPLHEQEITIGRDAVNAIVIQDDFGVAPFHARMKWDGAGWFIEKHPQAGNLALNGAQVQRAMVAPHATISLGDHTSFLLLPTHAQGNSSHLTQQMGQMGLGMGHGTELASLTSLGVPTLEISSNASNEKKVVPLLPDKQEVNIGRSSANDIVIENRCVSGQHLQIVRQGTQFVLIHPHPARGKTLNGLIYQGQTIGGEKSFRKTLVPGDVFRIGNENGTFVTLTYHEGKSEQQEYLPPVRPIRLSEDEITIGRVPGNTVVLAHPQVSAHHARLLREGGTYHVYDLHSKNHVFVNGHMVPHALLKMGDEIRIGPYRLVFETTQLTQYDESNHIRIDALRLKRYGSKKALLLDDISLTIAPRTFIAVVGGSGAGKSTLIKALSGLQPAQEGQVLYNGDDYYRNMAAFSTQLGYVPQDDIVHRDLPVERALFYAARMRLPGDFTNEQIQQRIREVLEDVELTGKEKMLVRKLSGGQRKRVSIALELLANPSIFFLDEPTSGLDPGLDRKMMFLLRKLADKGHTIILVTHATNNINTCDYVCFLTKGGRLAYFGPPDEAKKFFGRDDFAEIYSNLEPTEEKPEIPREAAERFRASPDYQTYVEQPLREARSRGKRDASGSIRAQPRERVRRGNPFKQFALLTTRHMELLRNNISNLLILLLQAPIVALILMGLLRLEIGAGIFEASNLVKCIPQLSTPGITLTVPNVHGATIDCQLVINYLKTDPNGSAYAQQRGGVNQALQDFIIPSASAVLAQGAIFLVAFFAVVFGCINGTREIVKERAIYERERAVNLGILPYLFSKVTVLGLLAVLQSVAILIIANAFEQFHQGIFLPVQLEVFITLTLEGIAGVMIGLVVSAFSPNDDTANSILPIILIPQSIFAGSLIPLKDWFTQIAAALFPPRWSMVAIGTSLGFHSDKIDGGKLFGNDYTYHGTLFSTYSQADAVGRLVLAWGVLAGSILVLTVLVGIGLKLKDRRA